MIDILASIDPGRIGIGVGSFLVIVVVGAIAGTIAALAQTRGLLLPSVAP